MQGQNLVSCVASGCRAKTSGKRRHYIYRYYNFAVTSRVRSKGGCDDMIDLVSLMALYSEQWNVALELAFQEMMIYPASSLSAFRAVDSGRDMLP